MYLSLLHVNVGNGAGREWLRNLYRVHQRLWMAFPNKERRSEDPFFLGPWDGPGLPEPKPTREQAGFLFRIERDGPARILVQSTQRPDWEYAFQNAPYLLACSAMVRQFEPTPGRDQQYRFRLVANVVSRYTVAREDGTTRTTRSGLTIARRRRKSTVLHPLALSDPLPTDVGERKRVLSARWDGWRDWLRNVASRRGFRVLDEEKRPLLVEPVHALVRDPKRKKPARYSAGLFEGVLVCLDPDRLRNAIIRGIGPAKAFGFGLLSVAPVA